MSPCGRPLTMPSRSSSPRSMPTPWTYTSIASPRPSRRTPTPSCCSIKPDGTARRRSRCRWEEPSTASKACVFLFLMSCLEPKEVVEESRSSSYIHGLERQRDAYSDHIGFSRAGLSIVSLSVPVVVESVCIRLGLHPSHDRNPILDYRGRSHRRYLVRGLLRRPLPSPAGKTAGVRSGE